MEVGSDFADPFTPAPDRCGELLAIVLRYVDPRRSVRVLDLGCGTGELAVRMAEALPGAEVVGLDISPRNIEAARRRPTPPSVRRRLSWVAGDYMEARAGTFGLIVSYSVLQYIPAADDVVFGTVRGDLEPGGVLVMGMPLDSAGNRLRERARRALRCVRTPGLDALLLRLARAAHGHRHGEDFLRQRLPYLYVRTHRFHGARLRRLLEGPIGLELCEQRREGGGGGLAAMPHEVCVYRRRLG